MWCLIVIGVAGFLRSLRDVTYGVEVPKGVSPSLASAMTDMGWLQISATLVGGVLSALMAWYFFHMSRKVIVVLYAMLALAVTSAMLQLIFNPPFRAWIAATGLWPLLISLIFYIALIAYAHHLNGNNRLEA